MNASIRYHRLGRTAAGISDGVEREIREGWLRAGDTLPTVRGLAGELGVSPGTVAAAYRTLRMRGMTTGEGRKGTRIAPGPPQVWRVAGALSARVPRVPDGVRDLATGNPDPARLPDLAPYLQQLGGTSRLYGEPAQLPELLALARDQFVADGVPAEALAVVGGALDGIERVLQAYVRPGDSVVVEDPGYPGVLDLLGALGLVARPVPMDDDGFDPDALDKALSAGAQAVVLTPRAHNPTGAVLSETRAGNLRAVLGRHPAVLVVEDDHAGLVAGAPCVTLADPDRLRWAVVRSVSKSLGPDLRLAVLAADDTTVARVEGRRQVGAGWVSYLLQQLVIALWSDPSVLAGCRQAADTYRDRRRALIDALAELGVAAHGASGLNVWIPVPEEQPVVAGLMAAGWAVTAGERFRRRSRPAVRITTATLAPVEAGAVAAEVSRALAAAHSSRLG